MKTFAAYAFVFVALVTGIQEQSCSPQKQEQKSCTPGSVTKVDCNTCICSEEGIILGCTRMACPKIPAEYQKPKAYRKYPQQTKTMLHKNRSADQICEPDTLVRVDCNTCFCNEEGTGLMCTKMLCPDFSRDDWAE